VKYVHLPQDEVTSEYPYVEHALDVHVHVLVSLRLFPGVLLLQPGECMVDKTVVVKQLHQLNDVNVWNK